ncbi:hypothetical protein HRE53_02225 [Acaryochloris sp. 'Moss Beach']|uniref:hypothetical protein n=1 Tax=Acaryochloris sp. 'Moss Beach' TaxID=2740837 RepID=UPI001F1A4C6C|nr:hypothetical protein [Acaryochloris sp. 'Moss Beach']UJB70000.1 hypothetical protein HRE53_02225 [Acaryochloris sp. 'Moss Beach']
MSSAQLRLNLIEGSVTFSFTAEAAQEFKTAISALMTSLKAVANKTPGEKVQPQPSMEYQYTGDVFLECFCNPNIWPSPFAAKVLITVRDDRIRLTTEAELTRTIEDLNEFIETNG